MRMANRERSPNYPALDLPTATVLAKTLYQKEGRSSMSLSALAQALGSTSDGLSGPFRSKIAALRQYGLIEKAGPNKAKLSPLGITIGLRDPGEDGYRQAVQEAALKPSLFADLWERFREGGSDVNIRNFLVEDRAFALAGAERAVRAFRETVAYAKLDAESYYEPAETSSDENGESRAKPELSRIGFADSDANRAQYDPSLAERGTKVSLSWVLSDKVPVSVTFGTEPTPKAIDRLIKLLEFFKDDISEHNATSAAFEALMDNARLTRDE